MEFASTTIARCSLFLPPIATSPHTITHGSHGPSKRKASAEPEQPLSEKRRKRSPTPVSRKTANTSIVTSTPASVQDVTSIIEEFSDVIAESPATKQVGRAKSKSPEETSVVTTPGSTDARSRSKASVVRPKPSVTVTAKQSAARKKTAKTKPELVTPAEFARRLQEQAVITDSLPPLSPQTSDVGSRKARQSGAKLPLKAVQPPQYLRDHVIFYTGGDLTYASARTRGCMNYVRALLYLFAHISTYKRRTLRFTDTVGPCLQRLTPQRPRISSRKRTRRTRFARLASRACRKYRWRFRRYIGAGCSRERPYPGRGTSSKWTMNLCMLRSQVAWMRDAPSLTKVKGSKRLLSMRVKLFSQAKRRASRLAFFPHPIVCSFVFISRPC